MRFSTFVVVLLLTLGAVSAQGPQLTAEVREDDTLLTDIIGTKVVSRHGDVGHIHNVLMSKGGGVVGYIVRVGGFAGIGHRHYVFRMSAFTRRILLKGNSRRTRSNSESSV